MNRNISHLRLSVVDPTGIMMMIMEVLEVVNIMTIMTMFHHVVAPQHRHLVLVMAVRHRGRHGATDHLDEN
jgi:hypothetical protein